MSARSGPEPFLEGAGLEVYLFGSRVGSLWEDPGRGLRFRYGERALAEPDRFRLSISLPVREEPYGREARCFFDNLLPEGEARVTLAAAAKFDPGDVTGLLGEVGGECAGAVSLQPAGTEPPSEDDWTYEPVSEEEPGRAVPGPRRGAALSRLSARQSLSGVHHKLALRRRGDRLWLPGPGAPGNVIVKRPPGRFESLTANELACLELLRTTGVPVARANPLLSGGEDLLESRRYDRLERPDGGLRRLHQEDFCQATGRPPAAKHQERGGPDLAEVRLVLQRHSLNPLEDLEHLVRWTFLSFLVGNCDGHAKNLSLVYLDEGPRLAPFYDVVSTEVYEGLDRRFALFIGGRETAAALDPHGLRKFARSVLMKPARIRQLGEETAEAAAAALPDVLDRVASRTGHAPILDRIETLVTERLEALRRVLRQT